MLTQPLFRYKWKKTTLAYRKNDHQNWSGNNTCAHLMSTVVKVARENHIAFDELKLDLFEDYKSMLETKMEDYKNSGKKHLFKVFVK